MNIMSNIQSIGLHATDWASRCELELTHLLNWCIAKSVQRKGGGPSSNWVAVDSTLPRHSGAHPLGIGLYDLLSPSLSF